MADVGYIRVSTLDQNTERQLDGLDLEEIFREKVSGKNLDRPQWKECNRFLRKGDTLHVHSIDRLARSTCDLVNTVENLRSRGVSIHFHKEHLFFSAASEEDPRSILMFNILAAMAQFERALILERQREGIAKAKSAGKYRKKKGKNAKFTPEQVKEMQVLRDEGVSIAAIARRFATSRPTVYKSLRRQETQED